MFEKIVLRRSQNGPAITLGEIAEALLFYKSVHLVLDRNSIHGLVRDLGTKGVISLLRRRNVTAVYCEEMLGTATDNIGGLELHRFVAMTISGDQQVGQLKSKTDRLAHTIRTLGIDPKQSRNFAELFFTHVPYRTLEGNHFSPGGVIRATKDDISDAKYIRDCVKAYIKSYTTRDIEEGFEYTISGEPSKFSVLSTLNLPEINEYAKTYLGKEENITHAHIVGEILAARADIVLASHYGGDFHTFNLTSEIIKIRHSHLMSRLEIDRREIEHFTEIVLPDHFTVRERIDSKDKTFDEFLKLLDKSDKFREWIQGQSPDSQLVEEYLKQIASEAWISRNSARALRYLLCSAVGLAHTPLGLALSLADSMVVDKLLGGWRPNHFVEGRLKAFLGEK